MITVTGNAAASIALRNAVFKVVPQALIKPVWLKAKEVAVGNVKSLSAKRQQVVDRLKQMGATEDRILSVVDKVKLEDVGVEEVAILIGLGTALKDGETTLEEAFPPIARPAPLFKPNATKSGTPDDGLDLTGQGEPTPRGAPPEAEETEKAPADAPSGQPEAPTGATAAKANRDKLVAERRALVAQIQAILDSPECTLKAAKKAKLMAGIDESTGEAWEMADTLKLKELVRLLKV